MAPLDPTALRVYVYDELLARGTPPTSVEIGARFGVAPNEACRALATLKIGKTILVHPQLGEVWMAGPFSAVPTSYRVTAGDHQWWANCAWDMFGVAMIANRTVHVDARCADCGESMSIVCDPAKPPNEKAVVHFLLPAARWYDDIGFT